MVTVLSVLGKADLPAPTEMYGASPIDGGGFVRRMPWPGKNSYDVVIPRENITDWFVRLRDAGVTVVRASEGERPDNRRQVPESHRIHNALWKEGRWNAV